MTAAGRLAAAPPSDEAALWRAVRTQSSPAARESLFTLHRDFARKIARRHFLDSRTGDIEQDDLRQLAYAGLLEAIDRFDPDRGVPFRGVAARRISGSILDGLAKMSEVREQISFRNRARAERARSLSISAAEADALSAGDALALLTEIAAGLALGFMLEDAGLVVSEEQADTRPSAYESLAWKEVVRRVAGEVADLSEREQLIMRRHYADGLTFEQIGPLLGLTKGRVSQLHKAAIVRLRTRLVRTESFSLKR